MVKKIYSYFSTFSLEFLKVTHRFYQSLHPLIYSETAMETPF